MAGYPALRVMTLAETGTCGAVLHRPGLLQHVIDELEGKVLR